MKTIWRLSLVYFMAINVNVEAQTVSGKSNKIKIDFKENTPSDIQLIKPEFADTRGFKKVKKEEIEVEGIARDEDGVQFVYLNNQIIEHNALGYFKTTIKLKEGDNELWFRIIDNEDESTSKTFYMEYDKPSENLTSPGEFYGLIIAINDYDDKAIQDLDNPIADATALHQLLSETYSFKPENNQLLINPSRADIIDGLDALSQKVSYNDNVLIFYAGHGYWDSSAEIGYWLPSDARKGRKSAWLRNSTLRDYIKEIDSRNTLLVADACFGGAIFKSRKAFNDASQAINTVYEMKSRKAMTSGTLTEVPDKSVFMKYMMKRLTENDQKYLAAEQLFAQFKEAVINNAVIEDAVPQYGTVHAAGDEGGDFVFIRSPKTN